MALSYQDKSEERPANRAVAAAPGAAAGAAAGAGADDATAKAIAFKNRLVDYDRNSAKRTTVIDDQSDYFEVDSNAWLTEEVGAGAGGYACWLHLGGLALAPPWVLRLEGLAAPWGRAPGTPFTGPALLAGLLDCMACQCVYVRLRCRCSGTVGVPLLTPLLTSACSAATNSGPHSTCSHAHQCSCLLLCLQERAELARRQKQEEEAAEARRRKVTFTIDLLGRRVVAPEEGEKLQQEREQQAAAAAAAAAGKGAKPGFAMPELPDELKVSSRVGPWGLGLHGALGKPFIVK